MSASRETVTKNKDQAPAIDTDSVLNRLNELEERCNQLETILKDTVTYDAPAARITGKKIVKKDELSGKC
jgi:hypothetical protein